MARSALGRNAATEEAFPAVQGTPPATAWPSPLINAGGRNGAKRPRLPLWESWHGEAVTEEAFPAAAAWDSPCHCVALPPHKCGGLGLSFRRTFHPGGFSRRFEDRFGMTPDLGCKGGGYLSCPGEIYPQRCITLWKDVEKWRKNASVNGRKIVLDNHVTV